MSEPTLILIVEDNPRNLKLARDVLEHAASRPSRRSPPRTAWRGAERRSGPHPDGPPAARHRRPRRARRLRADPARPAIPVVALTAFAMHDDRERCLAGRLRRLPGEADRRPRVPRPGARPARPRAVTGTVSADGRRSSSSTTCRRTSACSRRCSSRAATGGRRGSGEEALERSPTSRADLVLLDILMPGMDGYEMCRRLRADPATAFLPGRHGHGERRAGEGRRSRRAPTTSSPSRSTRPSCWRGCAPCCGSSATTTRSRRRPRRSQSGTPSWRGGSASRSTSSSGSAGCGASSRRRSPGSIVDPATSRSSRATAARSPSSSPTCGASPPSPRRPSPRRPWRCCASTTRRSASSSSPTRGRSSTSPATG